MRDRSLENSCTESCYNPRYSDRTSLRNLARRFWFSATDQEAENPRVAGSIPALVTATSRDSLVAPCPPGPLRPRRVPGSATPSATVPPRTRRGRVGDGGALGSGAASAGSSSPCTCRTYLSYGDGRCDVPSQRPTIRERCAAAGTWSPHEPCGLPPTADTSGARWHGRRSNELWDARAFQPPKKEAGRRRPLVSGCYRRPASNYLLPQTQTEPTHRQVFLADAILMTATTTAIAAAQPTRALPLMRSCPFPFT